MATGLVAWGVYLPYWRLDRRLIGDAFGAGTGRGTRSVASYDEDTTSMGVEAGRRALATPGVPDPASLYFSTPAPAYVDKTNATTVHAGLGLPPATGAYDLSGSVRSAWATLQLATLAGAQAPTMAVVSDLRTGLPGSVDESQGGDGAVAFVFAPDGGVTELVGQAAATDEFLDRWRVPGETASLQWEDRFGEEVYRPLARSAFETALGQAGLVAGDVDHLIVIGLHSPGRGVGQEVTGGAVRSGGARPCRPHRQPGGRRWRPVPGRRVGAGHPGPGGGRGGGGRRGRRCHPPHHRRPARGPGGAPGGGYRSGGRTGRGRSIRSGLPGLPVVAGHAPPRAPPSARSRAARRPGHAAQRGLEVRFFASRCLVCGFRHLPPTRICLSCQSVDQMVPERMADLSGTVATYTIDRLAFSLSPPMVGAVIDFDGGGRYRGEMTDVDPAAVKVGTRVTMTFRRLYSAQGVHNYFWKARPLPDVDPDGVGRGAGGRSEEEGVPAR